MWEEGWKAEMQTQRFLRIHNSFSAVLLILSLQK